MCYVKSFCFSLFSTYKIQVSLHLCVFISYHAAITGGLVLLSGEPDYFGRNKISSGGDLSHYSSASLY